jgi:diguanylate cyclase (GGDEF)-like protein
MSGYVAFIALLNLVLGYGLAVYLRRRGGTSFRQFLADLLTIPPADGLEPHRTTDPSRQPAEGEFERTSPAETNNSKPHPELTQSELSPAGPVENQSSTSMTGLATRNEADELLVELTAVSDPLENPASVVLVELDPVENADDPNGDRLLAGIANTVCELLAETHTAARFGQQQLLLLLPGDDETAATQRTERLRQRVEATEFLIDQKPVAATVSCALGQLSSDYVPADILASLQKTLDEAKRKGGNRTFLYDGVSPGPVVPPELNLAPQTCAV